MYEANNFHYLQLITAHFYHYDWQHLGLNLLAFIFLLYLIPSSNKEIITASTLSVVFVDIYLLLLDVRFYAGFSGINYAMIGLGCYHLIEVGKGKQMILIVSGLLIHVFVFSDGLHKINNTTSWQSLKQAHVLGFIAGFISKSAFHRKWSVLILHHFKW